MGRKWEEQTDEFDTVTDNGQHYRIEEWAGMEDVAHLGSSGEEPLATGMKRYCTSDDRACSRLDDQTFEIVALGLKVKRVTAT